MTNPTPSPWVPVWALIERSGWQAVQVALAAIILAITTSGGVDYNAGQLAILAGIAASITVLANGVGSLAIPAGLPFIVDLTLRTVRSGVAAFLAPIAASAVLPTDRSTWYAAALGGAVAAMTVIKGSFAERIGAATPATLPVRFDLITSTKEP
jgi:hypothetical protein